MKTLITTSAAALVAAFAAAGANAAEYARVVSSTPVTGSVAVPSRECAQYQQVVQQPPSGAGALIGAIAGGVLGNQFGHGAGRALATGAGVVAGSAIGNNVEASNNPATTVPVQSCRTVSTYQNRVVGYDVVYEYNGQRYSTRLPNDPGSRLAIDIRPTADAPLDRVGPPTTYSAVPPAYVDTPTYTSPAPAYVEAPPAYYAPAPVYYGGPGYYSPNYVAPIVGLGVGYWIGSTWHRGYGPGWGYRRWR